MPGGEILGRQKVMWIAARDFKLDPRQPVPLVLLEAPCIFRNLALEALERHGIPWRIAYSTSSLSGLRAAVKAGLGITPRTASVREGDLHYVPQSRRLPALGRLNLSLYGSRAPASPAVAKLAELGPGSLEQRPQGSPLSRGSAGSLRPAQCRKDVIWSCRHRHDNATSWLSCWFSSVPPGTFLQERRKKAILGATLRFARNQRPAASLEH